MSQQLSKICVLPWVHLNILPSGNVIPCCVGSHNYVVGNIATQHISTIWNSDQMKLLRKQMINGEEPTTCKVCFDRERLTGVSVRSYRNNMFLKDLAEIPNITLNDGTCTSMKLKYWDFRFNNVCNFKCRSCGPEYSSAWASDAKKLNYQTCSISYTTDLSLITDFINDAEAISFAGGEPLLMEEHWLTLELLDQKQKYIPIKYNTNCSVLTYKGKSIFDYWKKWPKGALRISPSIDDVGKRAELIRAGTVWSEVEENLIKMLALPNALIDAHITVSVFNVFRLPEIKSYLESLGVVHFHLNILHAPGLYHVSVLPDKFRQEIIATLSDNFYIQVVHELQKPFNESAARDFLNLTASLDEIRNENTFAVIPELNCIKRCLSS